MISLIRIVTLFLMTCSLVTTHCYGQRKLHAIIVVDNRSVDIQPQMDTARDMLASWVESGITWDRLRLKILEKKQYTEVGIKAAILNPVMHETDALLFYYIGHGYIDNDARPLLLPDNNPKRPLRVETILGWMTQRNANQRIAIFDMCQTHRSDIAVAIERPRQSPQQTQQFIESLFFTPRTQRYSCLISSGPGESALSVSPSASGHVMPIPLFTHEFIGATREWERDSKTWAQLRDALKNRVSRKFRLGQQNGLHLESGQKSQTVTEISAK